MRWGLALLACIATLAPAQASLAVTDPVLAGVALPGVSAEGSLAVPAIPLDGPMAAKDPVLTPHDPAACLTCPAALDLGLVSVTVSVWGMDSPAPASTKVASPTPEGKGEAAFLPGLPKAGVVTGGGLLAGLLAAATGLAAPKAVRRLAAVGVGIGLFSRIEGPRLLDQPSRAALWNFIQANPGVSAREAQLAAGIAWSTAVRHLRRLESAGLVLSHRHAGQRGYWVAEAPEARTRPGRAALKDLHARALAGAVLASPGANQADLAAAASLPAYAASRHLRRLGEAGLVAAQREGRTVRYTAAAGLGALLDPAPSGAGTACASPPMAPAGLLLAASRLASDLAILGFRTWTSDGVGPSPTGSADR